MNGTKITATATVARITAETVGDDKAIKGALSAFATFGQKNGEIGIRSYGFLASVVELTETKASELVKGYGVDKGRLSKAGKCVRFVVAEILTPDVVTAESYDSAVEYLAETYGSLNEAYSELFPTDAKEMTEEMLVKNFYSGLDKHDLDLKKALALLIAEATKRQGE